MPTLDPLLVNSDYSFMVSKHLIMAICYMVKTRALVAMTLVVTQELWQQGGSHLGLAPSL